jgi:hypothetical protein
MLFLVGLRVVAAWIMPFTANEQVETRPTCNEAVIPVRHMPQGSFQAPSGAAKKACDFPVAIAALFSHIGAACGPKPRERV